MPTINTDNGAVYYFRPQKMTGLPDFARELPDGLIDWWTSRNPASHRDGAERFKYFAAWISGNGSMEEHVDALEAIVLGMHGKDGPMSERFLEALAASAFAGYRKPGARVHLIPYIEKTPLSAHWMGKSSHIDCVAAVLGASS